MKTYDILLGETRIGWQFEADDADYALRAFHRATKYLECDPKVAIRLRNATAVPV